MSESKLAAGDRVRLRIAPAKGRKSSFRRRRVCRVRWDVPDLKTKYIAKEWIEAEKE
jgi:hypothetical protein